MLPGARWAWKPLPNRAEISKLLLGPSFLMRVAELAFLAPVRL